MNKNWIVEVYTQNKELMGISDFNSLKEANQYRDKLKASHDYIFNIYAFNEDISYNEV